MVVRLLDRPFALQPADGPDAALQSAPYLRVGLLCQGLLEVQRTPGLKGSRLQIVRSAAISADFVTEPRIQDPRHGVSAGSESCDGPKQRVRQLPADGAP